jgi:hypothetical protein
MAHKLLDTVVLNVDLPEHGLQRGDLGAVVQVYGHNSLEVEFVNGAGRTQALLTLKVSEVRAILPTELIAVRPLNKSA